MSNWRCSAVDNSSGANNAGGIGEYHHAIDRPSRWRKRNARRGRSLSCALEAAWNQHAIACSACVMSGAALQHVLQLPECRTSHLKRAIVFGICLRARLHRRTPPVGGLRRPRSQMRRADYPIIGAAAQQRQPDASSHSKGRK